MNDENAISYFPPHKVELSDWEKKIEQKDHTVFLYDKDGKLYAVNYKKFAYYSSIILAEKMCEEKRVRESMEFLTGLKRNHQ